MSTLCYYIQSPTYGSQLFIYVLYCLCCCASSPCCLVLCCLVLSLCCHVQPLCADTTCVCALAFSAPVPSLRFKPVLGLACSAQEVSVLRRVLSALLQGVR